MHTTPARQHTPRTNYRLRVATSLVWWRALRREYTRLQALDALQALGHTRDAALRILTQRPARERKLEALARELALEDAA